MKSKSSLPIERTLVLIKPDAVRNGHTDRIFNMLRENGRTIQGIHKIEATEEMIQEHLAFYPKDFESFGQNWLKRCKTQNLNPADYFIGNMTATEIGQVINAETVAYLTSGPLYPVIVAGSSVIHDIRKLVGATFPAEAEEGTIRNKFGTDNLEICLKEKRIFQNVVHAADSKEEAEHQIAVWFPELKNS